MSEFIDSSKSVNNPKITKETDLSNPPTGGSSVKRELLLDMSYIESNDLGYRLRKLEKQVQELYYLFNNLRK